MTKDHLSLERRNEALGHGVVQWQSHPLHRGEDARLVQALAEGARLFSKASSGGRPWVFCEYQRRSEAKDAQAQQRIVVMGEPEWPDWRF
jgi:hypothetical protein